MALSGLILLLLPGAAQDLCASGTETSQHRLISSALLAARTHRPSALSVRLADNVLKVWVSLKRPEVGLPEAGLAWNLRSSKPAINGSSQEPPIVSNLSTRQPLLADKANDVLLRDPQIGRRLSQCQHVAKPSRS